MKTPTSKYIDLYLPLDKTPTQPKNIVQSNFSDAVSLFQTTSTSQPKMNAELGPKMTTAVGTKTPIHYNKTDTGLFGVIFEAWANHLNLRTSPEDWWLPVITRVATLVDDHANKPQLRDYFVGGRPGKEIIEVNVPSFSIYDTDYTYLFNTFSKKINEKITVPGYVQTISSSFSTTTPDQLIGSQITIMKSFQKYFDYRMGICGCGIKGLEMQGTEEDWRQLKEKIVQLKKLLSPIESTLNTSQYFNEVENIYDNLLKTYMGHNMDEWWSKVLIDSKDYEYGPSGMRKTEVAAYNGWLVFFCKGTNYPIKAKELAKGEIKALSCLSSCPMKIIDKLRNIEDDSTLIAGILGYNLFQNNSNGVATLQACHGWALLLPPNSPLRKK